MATYTYDPAALSVGPAPGLTAVSGTPSLTIAEVDGERRLLIDVSSGTAVVGFDSANADEARDDAEIYVAFRQPSPRSLFLPLIREGFAGDDAYRGGVPDGGNDESYEVIQRKYDGGTTVIAGASSSGGAPAVPDPAPGDLLHLRFRVTGTGPASDQRLKTWINDSPEPETWQLTAAVDATDRSRGIAVIVGQEHVYEVHFVGIGTGGDSAPTGPAAALSAGAVTFVRRGETTATLTAAAPTGGDDPYAVQWQRAADASGSPGAWTDVPAADGLTFGDSGLVAGTRYHWRVSVTDDADSVAVSQPVAATTLPAGSVVTLDGAGGSNLPGGSLRTGGRTFACWADDDGTHHVTEVIESTGAATDYVVGTVADPDRHMAPAVAELPDGRLVVVYGDHQDAWCKVSTDPGTLSGGLGSAESVGTDGGGDVRYPQPIVTAEGAGTERIYIYHTADVAGGGRAARRIHSDDRGATWSAPQAIFTSGSGVDVYLTARSSAVTGGTLVGVCDGNPSHRALSHGKPGSAYLLVYDPDGGAWTDAGGDSLTLPLTPGTTGLVYDAAQTGRDVGYTVTAAETGDTVYAPFAAAGGGEECYVRAVYHRATGPWRLQTVSEGSEPHRNGPILDGSDPDTVYAMAPEAAGRDVLAYRAVDGGEAWTTTNLTVGRYLPVDDGDDRHHLYPIKGAGPGGPAWLLGHWSYETPTPWGGVLYLAPYDAADAPSGDGSLLGAITSHVRAAVLADLERAGGPLADAKRYAGAAYLPVGTEIRGYDRDGTPLPARPLLDGDDAAATLANAVTVGAEVSS